uniref:Uncharacterized protein n=1 Tax=Rhizophora mucronata TaxID=61149 RepID=A0A2P2QI13_RHIMU
MQKQYIQSIW